MDEDDYDKDDEDDVFCYVWKKFWNHRKQSWTIGVGSRN